jgi:CysZ protein
MRGVLGGFGDLMSGFGLVLRVPEIRKWAVIPVFVNLALYALLVGLSVWLLADLWSGWSPSSGWGSSFWWLGFVASVVIGCLILAAVMLLLSSIIAAPFYTKLAEAALRHLTGREIPSLGPFWRIALLTVWQEIVKFAFFLGIQALLIGVNFIPVVGTIVSAVAECLLVAFNFVDYPLEPLGYSVSARWKFVLAHRADSLGFGGGAFLLTFVPGLNLLTAPAAVAGGAKMVVRLGGANVR